MKKTVNVSSKYDEKIVSVPPLTVNILGKSKIPIAGQNQTIECEVSGSRPKPIITWWKDQKALTGAVIQVNLMYYL